MTVLEEEIAVGENLAPPRKKPCLSLSGRNRFTENNQLTLKVIQDRTEVNSYGNK